MKANPTLKIVHRLIIGKPHHDPAFEYTELHSADSIELLDADEYFPDFGI